MKVDNLKRGENCVKEIRCPKCHRRLFDVTEETKGPVISKCRCKNRVVVKFYSLNQISYITK